MSRLLLTIDTDGDAFRDNGWQHEAAQVLKTLAAVSLRSKNRVTQAAPFGTRPASLVGLGITRPTNRDLTIQTRKESYHE